MAIVMLSTELDEQVELMDRVLVFRDGELGTELAGERLSVKRSWAHSSAAPVADLRAQLKARPYLFAAALSLTLLGANPIVSPRFGAPSNWPNELAAFAPLALVAIGSTPSILAIPSA